MLHSYNEQAREERMLLRESYGRKIHLQCLSYLLTKIKPVLFKGQLYIGLNVVKEVHGLFEQT